MSPLLWRRIASSAFGLVLALALQACDREAANSKELFKQTKEMVSLFEKKDYAGFATLFEEAKRLSTSVGLSHDYPCGKAASQLWSVVREALAPYAAWKVTRSDNDAIAFLKADKKSPSYLEFFDPDYPHPEWNSVAVLAKSCERELPGLSAEEEKLVSIFRAGVSGWEMDVEKTIGETKLLELRHADRQKTIEDRAAVMDTVPWKELNSEEKAYFGFGRVDIISCMDAVYAQGPNMGISKYMAADACRRLLGR